MSHVNRVLMIAAENDSLPGAKVGGIGDVIRDLPTALATQGLCVDTAIPSYGFLARLDKLDQLDNITIKFANKLHDIKVFRRQGDSERINHYIFHHPQFYPDGECVYNDDGEHRPFATDSSKFAFFCTCVAQALMQGVIPRPNVLHCHDWHTAYVLVLIRFGYEYVALRDIRTVFTIHNLALQGIRPLRGDPSSFNSWFPDLRYSIDKVADPRYGDCVNAMRIGIVLADRVNTVSPSYAREILNASNYELGVYGGDGLENDLRQRTDRGDLCGILNGCEYPPEGTGTGTGTSTSLKKAALAKLMQHCIRRWASRSRMLSSAHWLAEKTVQGWSSEKAIKFTVTSVGRLTEQKMRVLRTRLPNGKSCLQGVLDRLGNDGVMIILGSGDPAIETFICETSANNTNLVFLNGYSDELSKALYDYGDLFLMPSSFEPCGISQMLAMRAGQPCLVNAVGGLRDTVTHRETGFVFRGETVYQQAEALVETFTEVRSAFFEDKPGWNYIAAKAAEARFTWDTAATQYIEQLYQ